MPKLSDWFLDSLPPPAARPVAPPKKVPKHFRDERDASDARLFEVQCHTVFGPLPRLTPRVVGRIDSVYPGKEGSETSISWMPGAQLHRHRLGHVEYDWRDAQ